MEKIEITTRFKHDGSLVPLEFTLGGKAIQLLNVGRQWETPEGKHILVMDFQETTYHLFFQLSDLGWYLIRDIKPAADPV